MKDTEVKRIETERLVIRAFRQEDSACAYKNWAGDERVQPEYGEPVYNTLEKTKALIAEYIRRTQEEGEMRWAICLRESGECIGQIAYYKVDRKNNCAELEYCIGVPFQNKGYVTEAAKAVVDFGFSDMELHKLRICRRSKNPRSGRVIEKCGFVYEGTFRDAVFVGGEYQDMLCYSILRHEWKRMKDFESSYTDILGSTVDIEMDRPMGAVHPKHPDLIYPINYGFVPGLLGGDGEGQDVYLLGVNEKIDMYMGAKVIAVIHRLDDNEDKWVACPAGMSFTEEDVRRLTDFQEKYYHSDIFTAK